MRVLVAFTFSFALCGEVSAAPTLDASTASTARADSDETDKRRATSSPRSNDEDAARNAFGRGDRAFFQRDYVKAIRAYERAYELVPHPSTLHNIARSQHEAGRLSAAWSNYARVMRSSISPEQRRATVYYLAEIETQLGVLELRVTRRSRVCIDGRSPQTGARHRRPGEDPTLLRFSQALAPGEHTIDYGSWTQVVSVGAGQTKWVDLSDLTMRPRAIHRLIATSAASGITALIFAAAARSNIDSIANDRSRIRPNRGMLAVSATASLVAATTSVVALLLLRRNRNAAAFALKPDPKPDPKAPPTRFHSQRTKRQRPCPKDK